MTRRWVLAAVHKGPYLALAPLEREFGPRNCVWLLSGTAAAERRRLGLAFHPMPKDFARAVAALSPRGLIRGTSELPESRNPERRLADAFAAAGLPVFAVEDFPGNYTAGPSAPLDRLFVEHRTTRRHHVRRGVPARKIVVAGNPRYAEPLPPAPARGAARARYGLGREPAVLWAGQPDGALGRRTLEALRPALRRAGAVVLFRAHPRDPFFGRPPSALGRDVRLVDVSREPLWTAVRACDLVVTQFSSLAVEAGRFGVPALFALLPGAGRAYLRCRTGMTTLPWCEEGSAFLLGSAGRAGAALRRALGDAAARRRALRRLADEHRKAAGAARRIAIICSSMTQGHA